MQNLRVLALRIQTAEQAVRRCQNPKFIEDFESEFKALLTWCPQFQGDDAIKRTGENLLIRIALVRAWRNVLCRPQQWGDAAQDFDIDSFVLDRSNERLCGLFYINCAFFSLRGEDRGIIVFGQAQSAVAFFEGLGTPATDPWFAKARLLLAIGCYMEEELKETRRLAALALKGLENFPALQAIATQLCVKKFPPEIMITETFTPTDLYKH